jgi:hypothetical protein
MALTNSADGFVLAFDVARLGVAVAIGHLRGQDVISCMRAGGSRVKRRN